MKHLFAIICCLITFSAFSQELKTSFSEPFEEPEKLGTKVVQCPNGNTLFFVFTEKDGITVDVYDKSRKAIAHAENKSDSWASDETMVRGIFAVGNDAVAFLQVKDEKPILYRLIFSAETGKITKEERTAEIDASNKGDDKYARYTKTTNTYCVKKDPASDAYAIAYYQKDDFPGSAKMVLIHYDGMNKEIQRAYIESPKQHRYNNIFYSDMVVNGTLDVFLCTYAYDNHNSHVESSAIVVSHLHDNTVDQQTIAKAAEDAKSCASIGYNKKNNTIVVLTLAPVDKKTKNGFGTGSTTTTVTYTANLTGFNPADLSIKFSAGVDNRLATRYRKTYLAVNNDFSGMPKDLLVDEDGTTTIVSEDQVNPHSCDVGIVDYDLQGIASKGYAIRKSGQLDFMGTGVHMDVIENMRQGNLGKTGPSFYSYDYYRSPSARLFFFNDHPGNLKNGVDANQIVLGGPGGGISIANTVCMRLTDGGVSRFCLFGDPNDDFDNRFADFNSGDYSEATGDYAVMIIERNGRKKQARVAWVHLK